MAERRGRVRGPALNCVGVIGASVAAPEQIDAAHAVGRMLAERGVTLICGGRGGVMEAACRGARDAGGLTVGILPGLDRAEANPYVSVAIPTGLGELRNGLVVRASDALVAVGGAYGTLSEVALALQAGKRVVGIGSWDIRGVVTASSPDEAIARLFER